MTNRKWNPRFVAYSKAHGKTPAAMLRHDKRKWPGGCMVGFMHWIQDRWAEWDAAHGRRQCDYHSLEDHTDFDKSIGASHAPQD